MAITLAGVDIRCTSFTVDGGIIDVDSSGPTGIFRENAVQIITTAMEKKNQGNISKFIREGLQLCCRQGLTSFQSNDESSLLVYKSLQLANQLPIRVFLTPTYEDINRRDEDGGLARAAPLRPLLSTQTTKMNSPESKLIIDRIKIFSDGSLGAETAALRRRSAGSDTPSDHSGVLVHSDASLVAMMSEAKELGYRLEVHAIGDAAAEQVLNAMAHCDIGSDPQDRPVLTHCQVLGPDLVERMRSMGVIANIQPSFVPTDLRWASQRLSPDKLSYSYAWRTLLHGGVVVAGGSDAPVEHCSPFLGMHDAIHRRGRGDLRDQVFRPEEALSFAEALWIYTVGAAFAARAEHVLGAIEIGYAADFVVVDPQIATRTELLATYEPELVIVGGRIVHKKSEVQGDSPATVDVEDQSRVTDAPHTPQVLGGPFIPGKNGPLKWQRNIWSCKCCRR